MSRNGAPPRRTGPGLRWRIVGVILLAALLPLALTGVGAWVVFGGMLEERSLQLRRGLVASHAREIDLYLTERTRALMLLAHTHSLSDLRDPARLGELLARLNSSYEGSFIDLGVIDTAGRHLAYAGPYQLEDKTYADQEWFREAVKQTTYVSDVFLGYRRVPHCILTVRRNGDDSRWLLRATINSEEFEALVQAGLPGQTCDAFLLDSAGHYQTTPRVGRLLETSPVRAQPHRGVRDERAEEDGRTLLRATTWLNGGRWLLVVQQDEAEVQAPIHRALLAGALVVVVALLVVAATTVLATWHLTAQFERVSAQREDLSRDLLRSARLASLGELSTGLAHEINNPLAIISAERTNLEDVIEELELTPRQVDDLLESTERIGRQVKRCGTITAKMLQFGRETDTQLQPTDPGPMLQEIVALLERQARVSNVALRLEVEPDLPLLMLDPGELQQVVLNLVNNSLHACAAGGEIVVSARQVADEVHLTVTDDGCGIPDEDRERIFQPFYTTKPPGQGTGLGLSVCYGIVTGWGGSIEADSRPGEGTRLTVRLPVERT